MLRKSSSRQERESCETPCLANSSAFHREIGPHLPVLLFRRGLGGSEGATGRDNPKKGLCDSNSRLQGQRHMDL